jgi:hypothetical protein
MADDQDKKDELLAVLKEIRDLQRESLDRQNRFLWVSIPIFAVLCIQVTLALFH